MEENIKNLLDEYKKLYKEYNRKKEFLDRLKLELYAEAFNLMKSSNKRILQNDKLRENYVNSKIDMKQLEELWDLKVRLKEVEFRLNYLFVKRGESKRIRTI